jgi:hypothetical protein
MKIRFCSPVKSHMGYAEMGRFVIDQLVQAGFDVSVLEIPMQGSDADFGELGAQAERLIGGADSADVNIVNMIPPLFERYRLPDAKNIGYTVFEADKIPANWVGQCNQMDALWVTSEWAKGVFASSGVQVPISVVGVHAIETAPTAPEAGLFRLLSIFQWSTRKNPVNLIGAYCAAFDGHTDTVLTLKVHRGTDPKQNAAFVRNAVNYCLARGKPRRAMPRIEIATEFCSSRQIQQLHAESHAYVSLAHAEGWGLPAWEATLAGKPVIHTGWSAPNEFVHEQGQVKYNLSPVYGMDDFVPFYDIGMNWAEPHLDDAIAKLRDVYGNYSAWTRNSLSHRQAICERYSLDRRVQRIKYSV